jgi:hypothetical protein
VHSKSPGLPPVHVFIYFTSLQHVSGITERHHVTNKISKK